MGSERREGRTGAKGKVPRRRARRPSWVEAAPTGRGGGGGGEGGSETGSGFFKGVGGESGTGVMSPPVGPRPPPSRRTPPYTYTRRFRCASSHVTGNPRNPPSLGGRGPRGPRGTAWPRRGRAQRIREPRERGHSGPRCATSHKLGGLKGDFGLGVRLASKVWRGEEAEELKELGTRLGA